MATAAERANEEAARVLEFRASSADWAIAEGIARPPHWLGGAVIIAVLLVLAAAVLFASAATVWTTVSAPGVIRTSAKVRTIRSEIGGQIATLMAAEGQVVNEGDVLIEMKRLLSEEEIEDGRSAVAELEALMQTPRASHAEELGGLRIMKLRYSGGRLENELSAVRDAVGGYEAALRDRYDVMPREVSAQRHEWRDIEAKLNRIRKLGLGRELATDRAELESRLAQLKSSVSSRRASAEQGVETAVFRLGETLRAVEVAVEQQAEKQRVFAPVSGKVSRITITGAGEVIAPNQELMQIIPAGGKLEARLLIANRDIAEIEVGMPVALKVDAFPHQEYGTLPGRVSRISSDAQVTEGASGYEVTVELERDRVRNQGGEDRAVGLGMTLVADIQTREQTVLRFALVEIMRLGDYFD